jgi:hypothetical protein
METLRPRIAKQKTETVVMVSVLALAGTTQLETTKHTNYTKLGPAVVPCWLSESPAGGWCGGFQGLPRQSDATLSCGLSISWFVFLNRSSLGLVCR